MTTLKNFLKSNFFAGILVLGPLVATFYLIRFLIGLLDRFLPHWLDPQTYLHIHIPGMRVILTFVLIVLVGALGRYYIFRMVFKWGEDFLHRLPVVSGIYAAIKKLAHTFMGTGEQSFKNVVMVEFPREGIYSIGFLTGVSQGETQEKTKEKVVNVFIPTTPNPTSGFFIMIPETRVIQMNMSIEQAFALIVSGGVITPKGSSSPKSP